MLECQVSIHDFSQAVKYIIEQKFEKVSKSCLHDNYLTKIQFSSVLLSDIVIHDIDAFPVILQPH